MGEMSFENVMDFAFSNLGNSRVKSYVNNLNILDLIQEN